LDTHFSDLLVALHITQLRALGVKKLGAVGIMVEQGFTEGGLEDLNLHLAGIAALTYLDTHFKTYRL
jgi:hypothetical protein